MSFGFSLSAAPGADLSSQCAEWREETWGEEEIVVPDWKMVVKLGGGEEELAALPMVVGGAKEGTARKGEKPLWKGSCGREDRQWVGECC
jgi:hypothetical protein